MEVIVPGVYTFSGLMVGRVYAIEDADGWTLIDGGIAPAAQRVLKQLAARGVQTSAVKRVLLTHAHPDHAGGLPELKALTGAEVMCSAIERPVTEGKMPIPRPPREALSGISKWLTPPETTLKGTPVDRELADGDTLPEVLGGLQAVFTPGHALGHLAFWQPERRILFCGDVIMKFRKMQLPLAFLTVDMEEDKRSIRRLVALQPSVICFGHGTPITENAASQLEAFAPKAGITS